MQLTKGLTIITGPTGVGKTTYAHALALEHHAPILSADSRQIYAGMPIGTAAPTPEQQREVTYHFVQTLPLTARYSAYDFAEDALELIRHYLCDEGRAHVLVVGGSMLYIRALLYRMDPIPPVDPAVQAEVQELFARQGLAPIRDEINKVDPEYLRTVDPNNHKRLLRALEVYRSTGRPFSSYHTGKIRDFPYPVTLLTLHRERSDLYRRINTRAEEMLNDGLIEETRALLPYRHENALNTIGYKESLAYLDGKITLEECKLLIQKNTRTFARQQDRFFQKLPSTILTL